MTHHFHRARGYNVQKRSFTTPDVFTIEMNVMKQTWLMTARSEGLPDRTSQGLVSVKTFRRPHARVQLTRSTPTQRGSVVTQIFKGRLNMESQGSMMTKATSSSSSSSSWLAVPPRAPVRSPWTATRETTRGSRDRGCRDRGSRDRGLWSGVEGSRGGGTLCK